MDVPEGFILISDEALVGPAEFVAGYVGDDLDVAKDLRVHALKAGVALPGARGPIDTFLRIVQRLRGRRTREDLGEYVLPVDWLWFHVPPGGRGRLRLGSSEEREGTVELGLLGLGLGSGRRVVVAVDRDFQDREHCLRLTQDVRARVSRWVGPDGPEPEPQIDVLEVVAQRVEAVPECSDCHSEGEPATAVPARPALDLARDPAGFTLDESWTLQDDAELEVGVDVPITGLDLTPSVAIRRKLSLQCDVTWEFPGGHRYAAYEKLNGWQDFPFWRRT